MSEQDCGTCNEHSGMESRQKLTTWLLGILIAMLLGVGGAQINMMLALRSDVSVVQTKLEELDHRYASSDQLQRVERELAELRYLVRDRLQAR